MADGGIGTAGLIIAIPGLVELGIKYIRAIAHKIKIYQNSGDYLRDHLQEHDIQTSQLEVCLTFIKDASTSFSTELEILIRKALSRLTNTLETALAALEDNIDEKENIKRWRYTLYGRSELKRELQRIEKDQLLFYRAVQWSVLSGGSAVEAYLTEEQQRGNESLARVKQLKDAINLRMTGSDTKIPKMLLEDSDIPSGTYKALAHSEAVVISVKSGNEDIPVALVEQRPYVKEETKKIRDIALILSYTDESMAILPCKGFLAKAKARLSRFELIFPLPQATSQPRTLRDILLGEESRSGVPFSLTWRLKLGVRLATAIMYVHTSGLVHKNIHPENLILLKSQGERKSKDQAAKAKDGGDLFLIGFEFARKEDEASARIGDETWWKNIYRHPQRQGVHPEKDFSMLHDIYSLGVVLLEIALWRSLVLEETNTTTKEVQFVVNRDAVKISDKTSGQLKSPEDIKKAFVDKAAKFIAPVFGDRYQDIVLMCLTCLDDGGLKDIENTKDQDGITLGMAYIEKILTTLDEIVL
jgi:serine/threonine protein kinase